MPDQINEAQVAKWKEQYGEVYKLDGVDDEGKAMTFYFRKPQRAAINRFIDETTRKTSRAMERLALDHVIYPDKEKLAMLFDKLPGLAAQLANELLNVCGMGLNFTSTRL